MKANIKKSMLGSPGSKLLIEDFPFHKLERKAVKDDKLYKIIQLIVD